jgi:alkanesulfonate monooxygenase SsuD/methylene tetrahydromethanopterin reductase-like flavin-dependent oxidoreductase (luciferase family)
MAAGAEIEAAGFDELWSNDHLMPVAPGADAPLEGLEGPVFEGWSVLFGWAAATTRARLGCLVSAAGYRNPAILVKAATALDHASGGRAAFGLGAGWARREHEAFGVELPAVGERLDRLEEAAAICRALLDGVPVERDGRWWHLKGATNDPRPLGPLPLLIGGSGPRRTLPIVARFADAWSGDGDDAAMFAERSRQLDDHCRAIGRDPAAVERTVGLPPPMIRRTRDAAIAALAETLVRHGTPEADAATVAASSPFVGAAKAVADALSAYAESGASAVMLDWPSPFDRPTLEALAEIATDLR